MNRYCPIFPLRTIPPDDCSNIASDIERSCQVALASNKQLKAIDVLIDAHCAIWSHFLLFAKALGVKHYIGLCEHPPTVAQLEQVLRDGVLSNSALAKALVANWPVHSPGWHWVDLTEFDLQLHIWFGDIHDGLTQINHPVDAILAHPEQLSLAKFAHKFSRLLCRSGLLISASNMPVHNAQHLQHAGFSPYPGTHLPVWTGGKATPATPSKKPSSVAVVGAGIAGALCAHQLAKAGLQVTLFDEQAQPAMGASGNWVGAFHPHFTRDDTPLSQLSRLGCEHTAQHLLALTELGLLKRGVDWDLPGHLLAMAPDERQRAKETLDKLCMPTDLVRWHEGSDDVPQAGYWMPRGGWVKPSRWVQASLEAAGGSLTLAMNHKVTSIPQDFDAVVIASAQHSLQIASAPGLTANEVKGQITRVAKVKPLPAVLSGLSYAIDANEGWLLLGATYERPVTHLRVSEEANHLNVDRFLAAYPQMPLGKILDARCSVRSVWPDRLPAVGPLPQAANVYLCTGFASRGLTWAAMAGWQISRMLTHRGFTPSLLDKLLPARYHQSP